MLGYCDCFPSRLLLDKSTKEGLGSRIVSHRTLACLALLRLALATRTALSHFGTNPSFTLNSINRAAGCADCALLCAYRPLHI